MPLYTRHVAASNREFAVSIAIVEEVARKLGGASVLGGDVRSQADLAFAVRNRLPLSALRGLSKAGLSEQEIERFVIPHRTRRHRAEKRQPLTVDESDRAVRLLRVQSLAEQTFEDRDNANLWLRRSLAELDGETPLAISQTETGARVIETILGKIAWGAAA
jgi:putative toxin-antitoxin system antitoxin component (TIGR02293 family)